jgi:alanyl-tRNA synthetase
MRVISDHIRALTFAIADGAIPSNEGRGYVLRRILRRAARFGRTLGLREPFLYQLVGTLVETMSDVFPEISEHQKHIEKVIKAEEVSFNSTLDNGLELYRSMVIETVRQYLISEKKISKMGFAYPEQDGNIYYFEVGDQFLTKELAKLKLNLSKNIAEQVGNELILSGEDAFKLYDTYGFPLDLTQLLSREQGILIDEKRFEELMQEQRERSRKSRHEINAAFLTSDLSTIMPYQ